MTIWKTPDNTPSSTHWKGHEETVLLDFLTQNLSTCGDGVNFPRTTWKPAAKFVNACTLPPGMTCANRDAKGCKNKWTSLKAGYHHVVYIKNASGLAWSNTDGVGVSDGTRHVWEQILKVCPNAKPYGNKGFIHFDVIDDMMKNSKGGKNKPKGGFVH
ncbi:hypothetical protein DFH29DRAFT_880250 [Suillus ampliporus]|nr:hypothetical protein DFH29DRAFT_880250 [Suillus ampliporus]